MFHSKLIIVASIVALLVPVGIHETLAGGGLKVIVHGNGQACVSSNNEDLGCRQISSQGTFEFDGSPNTFTACLNEDCQSGQNSPDKVPEHVYFGSNGGFSGSSSVDRLGTQLPQSSSGTGGWTGVCNTLQPVLLQSCSELANSDGTFTNEGQRAYDCIRNGIILATGGIFISQLPVPVITAALKTLTTQEGCEGIVNWDSIDQVSNLAEVLPFFEL